MSRQKCSLIAAFFYSSAIYAMRKDKDTTKEFTVTGCRKALLSFLAALLLFPFNLFSNSFAFASANDDDTPLPQDIPVGETPLPAGSEIEGERIITTNDRVKFIPVDTVEVVNATLPDSIAEITDEWVPRTIEFNPNPTKAVWLAALFPGLGQVYNRRYWKLPLIVGGYLGLGYATSWNNGMLTDYTKAYADIMDNDPTTRSYMDFFPSTVKEEDLDKTWLTNILRSRKNYFRRNRDLCIIGMVAVYLVAIVDAYVDASLAHFDISPDLSMEVYPSLIQDGRTRLPSMGLQWAITF